MLKTEDVTDWMLREVAVIEIDPAERIRREEKTATPEVVCIEAVPESTPDDKAIVMK